MKRCEPEQIGALIERLMKENNIDTLVDGQRVSALWPEVVGPGINRYTSHRWVEGGVLHVALTSAPLKNELLFQRRTLVDALNSAVGKKVITDIIFH